ncbi:MAG: AAA family ATPase [Clostridia bacterium]|nr:AAA family ATPase [Clostridia bacterium]
MCRVLLGALYAGKRLESRRYTYIDLGGRDDGAPYMSYEALYRSCGGGAIIARYRANDDREDDETATGESQQIETLCDVAKNHRNDVLTIVCLPRECTGLKERIYDCFGNITLVELREDFVDRADAEAYLRGVAKEHHIRADKQLFRNLEDNKCYLAAELKVLFDEWYNHKLKHTIYPQYKDLNAVGEKVVRAKPRGSAYDELREMIGLKEAKQVIDKALNYYKVQKLYRDQGLKQEKASVHMIFTGNPGTAKTTVARLFARIMRENGLLSKGHLVEVGRGDLVGRYVGWTAKTVQSKFKEAMGGVLFIDEAYSLVDGHSGSFGDEAINTIVQEMENHREDLIVIFAGYPDKMEEFLQKNPGLRSRIAFHIPFSDYDTEELCKIAQLIVRNRGMNIDEAAMTKLGLVFEQARLQHDFGNGRYVRNVFEQAKMNQASRLLKLDFEEITAQDLSTIKAEDIVLPPSSPKPMQKRRIGFY